MKSNRASDFHFRWLNVLLVMIPFLFCWFTYYEPLTRTNHSKQSSVLFLLIYAVLLFYFVLKLDGFSISISRIGELIFAQIIAVGVTDVCAAGIIWMLSVHFPNLLPGFCCFLVQCLVIAVFIPVLSRFFFAMVPPRKTIVIYDVRQGMENLIQGYGLDKRYDIVASYAVEEILENLDAIGAAEDVFLCGVHTHERNIILKYCIDNNIRVYLMPRVGDVVMSGAEEMHMFHLPFLRVSRYNPPWGYRAAKRLMDVVISGIALILLSPVMLAVSIAVKSDGGPAFYEQVRLTKDGKTIKIKKYRSMVMDAEKLTGAILSSGENDPRITKVGRFIRACRLDELPQLINIFVGDMSIVGPRPERPEIAAEYEKEFPEFRLRLQAKAGLTGYAQVYGKYNTTPYDKTLMDLMYIAHPSILRDLSIMLATVKILFSKESTEGVGAEKTELKYSERRN